MSNRHAYTIYPPWRDYYKLAVMTPQGDFIHFGGKYAEDYTIHKDDKRKKDFLSRHSPKERRQWADPSTAAFWTRWLLYNLPTIGESVANIEQTFGIKIRFAEGKENRKALISSFNKSEKV